MVTMSLPPLPPLQTAGPEAPAAPDVRPLLIDAIGEVLADWPLYRSYKYAGTLWKIEEGSTTYAFMFPKTLRLYCSEGECKTTQVWQLIGSVPLTGRNAKVINGRLHIRAAQFDEVRFRCRNCQRSEVCYFLHLVVTEASGEIRKVGQWPPLSREPDPLVVAGWNEADLLLYRDAMTFRNYNKGIGALPYLRRIIESHIHQVLDLIADANGRKPISGFDQARYEVIRNSHRFSDKLDFARDYLPPDLTPSGARNPIETLYELISQGIHERTEEECVDIFDQCKVAFEYVVKKLTDAKRMDDEYIESIRKL